MTRTLLLCSLLLCGCAPAARQPVVQVATDATFPPFHYLNARQRPAGFDLRLVQAAAAAAGLRSRILVLPYDELFAGLERGDHDVVAATTGVTPERRQRFLFTTAYFRTCQVAVLRADDDRVSAVADLAGSRVGAEGSGTSYQAMQRVPAIERVRLRDGEGLEALRTGRVDAWIVDEFAAVRVATESGGRLRALAEPVASERYAFVLAKGSERLKALLDRGLEELARGGATAELEAEFGLRRGPDWPIACSE